MKDQFEFEEDERRIREDAATTETIRDLVVKATKQLDWAQEETASPSLRKQSEIGHQIYVDEIRHRHS